MRINMVGTLGPALKAVKDFHVAAGFEIGDKPRHMPPDMKALALRLIDEELTELDLAASYRTPEALAKVAHECADLLYVVLGFAVRSGIDLSPVFDAIHEANMAKAGGPRRADGKLLKPSGWKPADVAPIIEHQLGLPS